MSRIIEALERVKTMTRTAPQAPKRASSKPTASPTPHQMTQKELADIYFASSSRGKQSSPTLIRVVDGKRNFVLPWIITLAALLLTLVALFSGKHVSIAIQVMDGAQPQTVGSFAAAPNASKTDPRGTIYVQGTDFKLSQTAALNSLQTERALTLTNSSANPTYATLFFKPPFRASGFTLSFEAKGAAGDENLELILRDDEYRSSLNHQPIRPFAMGLSEEWQPTQVEFQQSEAFNIHAVTQLRFEIGVPRTGNTADASVSIRNVKWIPRSS